MTEIILLTGELQTGKTNLCLDIYQLAQESRIQTRGVISPGVFKGDMKTAIDALDLKSGSRKRLAELRSSQETGLETQRWSFFPEVVAWGNNLLLEAVPCDLLMIDELGPLEFQRGEGWVHGFTALDSGDYQMAIVVIRPSLLNKASERWEISRIVDLKETDSEVSFDVDILHPLLSE